MPAAIDNIILYAELRCGFCINLRSFLVGAIPVKVHIRVENYGEIFVRFVLPRNRSSVNSHIIQSIENRRCFRNCHVNRLIDGFRLKSFIPRAVFGRRAAEPKIVIFSVVAKFVVPGVVAFDLKHKHGSVSVFDYPLRQSFFCRP